MLQSEVVAWRALLPPGEDFCPLAVSVVLKTSICAAHGGSKGLRLADKHALLHPTLSYPWLRTNAQRTHPAMSAKGQPDS